MGLLMGTLVIQAVTIFAVGSGILVYWVLCWRWGWPVAVVGTALALGIAWRWTEDVATPCGRDHPDPDRDIWR